MKNPPSLAVAFVLVATLSMTNPTFANPGGWRGQSVTEFSSDENPAMDWQIVNDGVMGGLSEGRVELTTGGTMRFFGDLSLENNGGFSTIRSGKLDLNLSNDLGLLLRVKGDGRTYEARLDSDARYRGMPVSFAGKFKTTPGQWMEVKIPWSDFEGSWRGTDLPDAKLNPAAIQQVGILLADKKPGAFEVEVDWIRTYGKGQGVFTETSSKPAPSETAATESRGPRNLIDTAVADGRFTTLKKALDAAGLTVFFQWNSSLTIFAPTDEAFAKLPKETLADLLKPENKKQLVAILSYHVAVGNQRLVDALSAGDVGTVEGSAVRFEFRDGRIRVNEAALLDADIQCRDGILHAIDTVLLPPTSGPERKTILTTAAKAGTFTMLLSVVEKLGLQETLGGEGPFTVFAPTDEAFAALPNGVVTSLLNEENRGQLNALIKHHVVAGRISAGAALDGGKAQSLQGGFLEFSVRNGLLKVGDATILTVDIDGGNGLIHIIDEVLALPPTPGDAGS